MSTYRNVQEYERATFRRFAEVLSENGKTHVITNRTHRFIGFVMPLVEMPELVVTERWNAEFGEDFNLRTEILGWVFFHRYAAEAWRISNKKTMAGNLIGLPKHVRVPPRRDKFHGYSSRGGPECDFELSLHDREIERIDALALKRFAIGRYYDSALTWPVNPWIPGRAWHYQWTRKGEQHLDESQRQTRHGGYYSWEEIQARHSEKALVK